VKKERVPTGNDLAREVEQAVYAAAAPIYERAERQKLVFGNGHHMAQKLAQEASALLHERMWKEEGVLTEIQLEAHLSKRQRDIVSGYLEYGLDEGAYVINLKADTITGNDMRDDVLKKLPGEAEGKPLIVVAKHFQNSAIELAYEHEDVVLCTEKDGKWKVVRGV